VATAESAGLLLAATEAALSLLTALSLLAAVFAAEATLFLTAGLTALALVLTTEVTLGLTLLTTVVAAEAALALLALGPALLVAEVVLTVVVVACEIVRFHVHLLVR